MSQIPFVNQLGDALQQATSEPRRARRRLWRTWRMVPVIAILVAGVAAAATVLNGTTQLAAESISCISGTGDNGNGAYDIQTLGRTPEQACSGVVGRPAAQLVACDGGRYGVVVYYSTGRAGQCASLGYRPLPADYAADDSRVNRLVVALTQLYNSRDCMSPTELASGSDAVLRRLGFVGWRAQLELGPAAVRSGPCGAFPGTGSSDSSAAAAIDSHGYPPGGHDLVMIDAGPSRSMDALSTRLNDRLLAMSGARCLTLAEARADTEAMMPAGMPPAAFTVTRLPAGVTFGDNRQARYKAGCTIFVDAGTGSDGRTMEVALENRHAAGATSGPGAPSPAIGLQRSAPVATKRH
jgi:hypothetical protein